MNTEEIVVKQVNLDTTCAFVRARGSGKDVTLLRSELEGLDKKAVQVNISTLCLQDNGEEITAFVVQAKGSSTDVPKLVREHETLRKIFGI